MVVVSRNARQRLIIAEKAMDNHEVKALKIVRDRTFAELVYKQIFHRTGGNSRSWLIVLASVQRVLLFKEIADADARRKKTDLNESRVAIVSRFLRRAVKNRRRNGAANVLRGALGALTNSNTILRYAKRVRWSSRYLQAFTRRRIACTAAHIVLLSRHWDRMFLSHPPPAPQEAPRISTVDGTIVTAPNTPLKQYTATTPAASPKSVKPSRQQRPLPRRGGKDTPAEGTRKKFKDSRGGDGKHVTPQIKAVDDIEAVHAISQEDGDGRSVVCIADEAKAEEIVRWLRRARERQFRELLQYERFTIFPHMVELLLQTEPNTYRSRLQALHLVNALKSHGRLSKVWVQEGYREQVEHLIPPSPRLRRLFSRKEGEAMHERALARSAAIAAAARPFAEDDAQEKATVEPHGAVDVNEEDNGRYSRVSTPGSGRDGNRAATQAADEDLKG